jgi:iron complex transport system ATP-binding protein
LEITLMGRAPHLGGLELESEKDLEIAKEAMKKTGTWELKNRSMHELSGGEAQRVILSRALAQQPEILLMDEPTTHLDIKRQISIMELISELNRSEKLTVVTISHDLNLIARYVDYVFLMKKGKIVAQGEPATALTKESIREVYEAEVEVFNLNGKPAVIPISKSYMEERIEKTKDRETNLGKTL